MAETITDCGGFLAQAGQAFSELAADKDNVKRLEEEVKRLDKNLTAEKRAVEDEIVRTIKKRENEITSGCDKEISAAQDKLKKAKSKREKAKNQKVKDRIAEETEPLKAENRDLKMQMQTLFQNNRMPSFCMSHLYYSLYLPKRPAEFLTLIAALLLCFGALPLAIYSLISGHKIWQMVLIYLAVIALFGIIYMTIGNRTKPTHLEVLKQGRALRADMRENRKRIRKLAKEISHDKDEARYNLEKYDDEIAGAQQELTELTEKKKEALNTFETVTRDILKDEVEAKNKERLDGLAAELGNTKEKLTGMVSQLQEKEQQAAKQYGEILGTEFMSQAKTAALADIISQGKAADIPGAIEVYKSMEKG